MLPSKKHKVFSSEFDPSETFLSVFRGLCAKGGLFYTNEIALSKWALNCLLNKSNVTYQSISVVFVWKDKSEWAKANIFFCHRVTIESNTFVSMASSNGNGIREGQMFIPVMNMVWSERSLAHSLALSGSRRETNSSSSLSYALPTFALSHLRICR